MEKRALVECKILPLQHFGILIVNNLLNQSFKIYKHQSTFHTFLKILIEVISKGFNFIQRFSINDESVCILSENDH